MKKTTASQIRASENWNKNNVERRRYNSKKSACKGFILNVATEEDLSLVELWLQEAKENLKSEG